MQSIIRIRIKGKTLKMAYIKESIFKEYQEICKCETRYFTDDKGNNFSITAPSYCFCAPDERVVIFEVVSNNTFCPPIEQITQETFADVLKSLCPCDEEGQLEPLQHCTTYLIIEENEVDVLDNLSNKKDRLKNPCDVMEALGNITKHKVFVDKDSHPMTDAGWETRIEYRKDNYYDFIEKWCGVKLEREYKNKDRKMADVFKDIHYIQDKRGVQFKDEYT